MKKLRNKILSAVLVLSLLLTSSSFAFAVDGEGTTEEPVQEVKITSDEIANLTPSSQNNSTIGQAENIWCAFDGNISTGNFWHTRWAGGSDSAVTTGKPRSVIVEFKDYQWVDKLVYYPRSGDGVGTQNGRFEDCNIYTGDTIEDIKSNSRKLVGSGNDWENNADAKTIVLAEPVFTKYIMIEAPVTYGDDRNNNVTSSSASALEIELYKDMSKYPTITEQPKSAVYAPNAEIGELTVSANSSVGDNNVSYQWYESNTDGYNGTVIENATSYSYKPQLEPDGTKYYYVKVTDNYTGASVYSDIAVVSMHNNSDNDIALVNGEYYNTLTNAISAVQAGGTVWIIDDIALTSNITINNDVNIKSVDNLIRTAQPFTIKRTAGNNNEMFTVATTGNLTLDNIIIDGGAEWGNSTPAEGATNSSERNGSSIVRVNGNGQLTIGSNAILQNNESVSSGGGAIIADSGSGILNIYGKILNNKTINNKYCNGGGIVTNGKLSIYEGALIKGNYAALGGDDAGVGGGIQLYGNGYLSIYGGTIENNKAGRNSDNISFSNNNQMILSGNFNIENIDFNNVNNPIKIVGDVAENSVMTIITNSISDRTTFATIDEGVDVANIINSLKISNLGENRVIYRYGNDVKVGRKVELSDGGLISAKSILTDPQSGTANTNLTVTTTTGDDITYQWYKMTSTGSPEKLEGANEATLTLEYLAVGSHIYYCVVNNGDESTSESQITTSCTVKVSDFYPCSKAIEKFKSI